MELARVSVRVFAGTELLANEPLDPPPEPLLATPPNVSFALVAREEEDNPLALPMPLRANAGDVRGRLLASSPFSEEGSDPLFPEKGETDARLSDGERAAGAMPCTAISGEETAGVVAVGELIAGSPTAIREKLSVPAMAEFAKSEPSSMFADLFRGVDDACTITNAVVIRATTTVSCLALTAETRGVRKFFIG